MNLERIEAILRLLERQGHIGEVDASGDGWRLSVRRLPGLPIVAVPEMTTEPGQTDPPEPLDAPLQSDRVGVFRACSPRAHPGDLITPGSLVGYIDSMRIPNPVKATVGGRVKSVLVEDGDPVEFGQTLLILTPQEVET